MHRRRSIATQPLSVPQERNLEEDGQVRREEEDLYEKLRAEEAKADERCRASLAQRQEPNRTRRKEKKRQEGRLRPRCYLCLRPESEDVSEAVKPFLSGLVAFETPAELLIPCM